MPGPAPIKPLTWDEDAARRFQLGVDHGILFPYDSSASKYAAGIAWNGLINVTEKPDGAKTNKYYADNIVYGMTVSAETFAGTIQAYDYPDEFGACDGSKDLVPGMAIGQQSRQKFAFAYRTKVGNATSMVLNSFIWHIIYGATASPSEKSHDTVNDSPEFMTMSWDFDTNPTAVSGSDPTSTVSLDSRKLKPAQWAVVEKALVGDSTAASHLPTPDEFKSLITAAGV